MRKLYLLLLAVVPALVLVAVGQGGTDKEAAKTIQIGTSLPLTGDFAEPGTAAKRGYTIWQQITNSHGGLLKKKVKVLYRDDASDQNTVVSDYNRLIHQNRVDLLLGTFSSLLNLPASAIAERNGMVYVCPACGSPKLFARHYKFFFFAQPATAVHQADQFSGWIKSLSRSKRPKRGAYPAQDDPFAAPVIDGIHDKLKNTVRTVYQKIYPPDTTNFDTIASAIKASKADMIAEGSVFEDGVGLIRSLKKIGYNPKALFETTAPSLGKEFSKAVGLRNTNGIFYAVSWSDRAKYPGNREFVRAYMRKYHVKAADIPEDAADAYAAAQVLATAVKKVGKIDQDKIRKYLHSHRVMTILGPLHWDKDGAPQGAFLLAQWQNGRTQIVLPKRVATTKKIIYPKPRWR